MRLCRQKREDFRVCENASLSEKCTAFLQSHQQERLSKNTCLIQRKLVTLLVDGDGREFLD